MSSSVQPGPIRGRLVETLTFARAFFNAPNRIGSMFPSSPSLSRALIAPFRRRRLPASVLELGAGTGAVTRHLCSELRPGDQCTICELRPELADIIKRDLNRNPQWAAWMRDGRIELFVGSVQDLPRDLRFDYIVSGLPFNSFTEKEVCGIIDVVRSVLKPNGVFSYFEYIFLRRLSKWTTIGSGRERIHGVSRLLNEHIANFQVSRRTVLANVLPAHARHWQFDSRFDPHSRGFAVDSGFSRS